jgi:hypothetical protein
VVRVSPTLLLLAPLIGCAPSGSRAVDRAGEATETGGDTDADGFVEAPVTVSFAGTIVTVAGAPLGLGDADRGTAVSGSFTYDAARRDDNAEGQDRGEYPHQDDGAFDLDLVGRRVSGSGSPVVTVIPGEAAYFYFADGPRFPDYEWPRMSVDGATDPVLNVWIALCGGIVLADDPLPSAFPAYDPTVSAHTFSVEDEGGTALLQLTTVGP